MMHLLPPAPVNKLVSLTWLLLALRSFQRFTLHYITPIFSKVSRQKSLRCGVHGWNKLGLDVGPSSGLLQRRARQPEL